MKRFFVVLLTMLLTASLLAPSFVVPITAAAEAIGSALSEPIDAEDVGLTIDNHDELEVNYADDSYQSVKRLEEVPYTYEAWVKLEDVSRSQMILSNYRSSGAPYVIFSIRSGGYPSLSWMDTSKVTHVAEFAAKSDDADGKVIAENEWTHVVISYDAEAYTVSLYINGELYDTKTDQTVYTAIQQNSVRSRPLCLAGDYRYWNTYYFKNALQDVALYSVALTADEVKEAYESGVNTNREDLLLFYDITSADRHTNIADASGNGYDLFYSKLWLIEDDMNEIRRENGLLDADGNETYAYSFAVVGDTQYVTHYYPENLSIIYQWIADNKDAKKMQYVLGVGDITDNDTKVQWAAAKDAISILDGVIDYSLVRGNHDVLKNSDYFDYYFASDPAYTAQFEQYGGFFEVGSVENTYRTLRVGKSDWLFLNLDWGPSDEVIDWACEVVASHPDHRVIITTHGYLNHDGTTLDAGDGDAPGNDTGGNNADQIWTKLASQYENVELVLCGHISMENIVVSQTKGVHGNTVTQMLIDPQRADYYTTGGVIYNTGGAGVVTMLYFDESGTQINVEHYSTIRKAYYKTWNQMSVDLEAECEGLSERWDGVTAIQPYGSGTEEDPYLITNGANLHWISKTLLEMPSGKNVCDYHCLQINDIDLMGNTLISIGGYYKGGNNTYRVFSGVYDGNGHTIRNGCIVSISESSTSDKNYYASGLFGMISGAVIRNVTMDRITSYTKRGVVGVLVGSTLPAVDGIGNSAELNVIENCTVTASCRAISVINRSSTSVKTENNDATPRAGGIAGALAYTTVRNCVNEATVYVPGNHAHAGGIAGSLYNDCVIDSCVNKGTVELDFTAVVSSTTAYRRSNTVSHVSGGLIGSVNGVSTIIDSKNNATDGSANNYLQGNIIIANCRNSGNCVVRGVAEKGKAIIWGGILGFSNTLLSDKDVVILNCSNSGTVTVEKTQTVPTYLGGIVGYATHAADTTASKGSALIVANCANTTELPKHHMATVNAGALAPIDTAHNYSAWSKTDEALHSTSCTCGCGSTISLAHRNSEHGYCEDCEVDITGASITVGKDLTMNYYVKLIDAAIVKDAEKLAMRFTMNGKAVTVTEYTVEDGEYVFAFTGIAPQCMNESIKSELLLDETVIASKDAYSVRENAEALLAAHKDNEKLEQLVVDMLAYGAAAQAYKGHKADAPASAGITGTPSAELPATSDKSLTASASDKVYFTAATVWFDNVNKIGIKISTAKNVKLIVKIGDDATGTAYENLNSTVFYTDAISATSFDTVYTFELYEGETLVQTMTYSVASYVHAMQSGANEKMKALSAALYNYGRSAVAYRAAQ